MKQEEIKQKIYEHVTESKSRHPDIVKDACHFTAIVGKEFGELCNAVHEWDNDAVIDAALDIVAVMWRWLEKNEYIADASTGKNVLSCLGNADMALKYAIESLKRDGRLDEVKTVMQIRSGNTELGV